MVPPKRPNGLGTREQFAPCILVAIMGWAGMAGRGIGW
jgi:hypothetical protein